MSQISQALSPKAGTVIWKWPGSDSLADLGEPPEEARGNWNFSSGHRNWQQPFLGARSTNRTLVLASTVLESSFSLISTRDLLVHKQAGTVPRFPGPWSQPLGDSAGWHQLQVPSVLAPRCSGHSYSNQWASTSLGPLRPKPAIPGPSPATSTQSPAPGPPWAHSQTTQDLAPLNSRPAPAPGQSRPCSHLCGELALLTCGSTPALGQPRWHHKE